MRKTKISADISRDAKTLLDEYSVKHERSKGWLLDKMIRRYCAEIELTPPVVKVPKKKIVVSKIIPSNFNEQFDRLWAVKNVGVKKKAKQYLEREAKGNDDEDLELFVSMMINDITDKLKNPAVGFEAQHLSSYINGECYES